MKNLVSALSTTQSNLSTFGHGHQSIKLPSLFIVFHGAKSWAKKDGKGVGGCQCPQLFPRSLSFCYSSSTGCCALLIIVPNQLPQSLFLHKIQLHFFLPSLIPSEIAAWCRATSNAIRERIDQTFLPSAERVGKWSTSCLKNVIFCFAIPGSWKHSLWVMMSLF